VNQAILKQKEAVVDEVVALAQKAAALVLVEYRGMNVTQIGELRRLMRGLNAHIGVYKNTMVRRASDKLNYHGLVDHLTGPNALVFCPDPIEGPKALVKLRVEPAHEHQRRRHRRPRARWRRRPGRVDVAGQTGIDIHVPVLHPIANPFLRRDREGRQRKKLKTHAN
jgi:hypothetical protein